MNEPVFEGHIGRTFAESKPWWPADPKPAKGTPNVVIVVFDDVGFAHFNNYGSTLHTPNLNRLAAGGLRFTNFHTTALCSPTRACLLTGRNHHAVGMRAISNFDTGFPNMRGAIPHSVPTIAEILRDRGYGTYMVGKWHLAPMAETSPAGPFRNWPLARGFDRFYGFLQGETDQFRPELVQDNHYIEPPATPEQGYHVTEDLVDKAIGFAHDHISAAPDRPFLTYLAFGACHSPHQAPQAFLDKYRGQFDEGWDVFRERWFARQKELGIVAPDTDLPPRNPGVKAWDSLSDNEKRFTARLQEAFAAFLDHTDHHLGRYIDALEKIGQLDNTIFIAMSDNGASQEGGPVGVLDEMRYFNGLPEDVDAAISRLDLVGGPDSHTNYPWGWAMVGNTPLKRYKQNTHAGGIRDPLIVHWPAGIKDAGSLRHQFHHVTDIAPTLLELIDARAGQTSAESPVAMHGTSMAYALRNDAAGIPTRKPMQYFEMLGHRALWHDGWKAVCYHQPGADYDTEAWELYHADKDTSEAHDLASQHPEKLRTLIAMWWTEAGRNGVLPLDDRRGGALFKSAQVRGNTARRTEYKYYPPVSRYSADVAPPTGNRPFNITAELTMGSGRQGCIVARGSANGGYVLFVLDGHLVFDYNYFHSHTQVRSSRKLPAGACVAGVRVARDGQQGHATLFIDQEEVGNVVIPQMATMVSSTGMDVARSVAPVCHDYQAPFVFEGDLRSVTFDIATPKSADARKEALTQEKMIQGLQ